MKRFKILFVLAFLLVCFSPLVAQGIESIRFEIDQAIVVAIMTIGGLGVIGITQIVKNALIKLFNVIDAGAKDILGYVSSLIVSTGASAFILLQMKKFTWLALVVYSVYVWLESNQIFKVFKKPSQSV
jgi:hypothetical protein